MDSADYRLWMREQFPEHNQGLDEELSAKGLARFADEIQPVTDAIAIGIPTDSRERFTYISMIHSAMYHHRKRTLESEIPIPDVFETLLAGVEKAMIELANALGVEHRFLSVFYLFYNPEIPDLQGTFAQFRPDDYETAFLRINKEGTLQYKLASQSLSKAYDLLSTRQSAAAIETALDSAASAFRKISHGNSMLLNTPGGEEFKYLTQYFGEVRVADGPPLRGVNAGDQPWPYIIDLLFGVNLKRVFERAFEGTPSERHYPSEVRTSADVVAFEFQSREYLRANYLLPEDYAALTDVIGTINRSGETLPSAIKEYFSGAERAELTKGLHTVIKHYLAASNVHYQLARRHVPKNPQGEQIGSAGTNIVKFLREGLNAERESVKREIEQQYPELSKKETESIIA
ncbi:MAG TPA: monodechloroaminopyrrolnitrin synthase PrnB family protein [Candidatus Kapabacteria bacterium]|nr:monodechloroaminopyrrolnitrin synthase PrnB family protein [Candidatus Kapabacteria bacterium]